VAARTTAALSHPRGTPHAAEARDQRTAISPRSLPSTCGNFLAGRRITVVNGAHVTTNDEQLIDEIRHGSRAAGATLFARYRQPIWEFFRRRTVNASIAEELAQDTFVALLEGAARYEPRGVFRSYLFGIAYRVLLAHRRNAAHRTEPLDVEPADRTTPEPEAGLWVRAALARLDESDRELLMLREYEQLSYQEIAILRRTPVNTVRSQLFRARLALKVALEIRAPFPGRTTHVAR
jgi:RNA polymerase sigma-70 factor (ECF subfamily)